MENFIPVTFPEYAHGKEHTRWVIRTARANKMVFFAIIAAGASICVRFPDTISSSRVESGYGNISMGQILAFKMAALKHIRHTFTRYQAQDWITILYSVTCLAVAAVSQYLCLLEVGLTMLTTLTDYGWRHPRIDNPLHGATTPCVIDKFQRCTSSRTQCCVVVSFRRPPDSTHQHQLTV